MIRHRISTVVMGLLGLLLLTAAVLKGYELLARPLANNNLWSYRPFLIFEVEFEVVLGLWLVSGLWRRWSWWIALLCFVGFCGVTLYKGLTGAESCGCFGQVHVNPWITLSAIDVPAVLLLLIFRPRPKPISRVHYGVVILGLTALLAGVTTTVLVTNKPQRVTATREVLEPHTWIGQPLPIMTHIDRAGQLQQGNWLIMLFHYDCTDCIETLPDFQQIAENMQGNESVLQLALIEVPPYGYDAKSDESPYLIGRMDDSKEWLVVTPAVLLLSDGVVQQAWKEGTMPTFDEVLEQLNGVM